MNGELEDRFGLLSTFSADYIVRLEPREDGPPVLTTITESFRRVWGYRLEELRDPADWRRVLHPEDRGRFVRLLARALGGKECHGRLRGHTRDGTERSADVRLLPVLEAGSGSVKAVIVVARDVTGRRRVELDLEQRARELESLRQTVLDFTAVLELDTLLRLILQRAASLLNARGGTLFLADQQRRRVRLEACHNVSEAYLGTVLDFGEGVAGRVAESGQPMLVENHRRWSGRSLKFEEDEPFAAMAAAPMVWRGRVVGVILVLDDEQQRRFDTADLNLLSLFAAHAAVAVENARLYGQAQQELEERSRAEEALAESARRYEAIFENALVALWYQDISALRAELRRLKAAGGGDLERNLSENPELVAAALRLVRTVDVNQAAMRLYGASTKAELLGSPARFFAEETLVLFRRELAAIAAGERSLVAETVGITPRGERLDILVHVAFPDPQAADQHQLVSVVDITERKRAERELRSQRDRAQRYLDIAQVMLVSLDRDGRVAMINRKGCSILGCTREQAVGADWFDRFLPPRVRTEVREFFDRMVAGEAAPVQVHENPVLTSSGEERLIAWRNTVVRDEAGRFLTTLSSGEDITERRRSEEEREWQTRVNGALSELYPPLVSSLGSVEEAARIILDKARELTDSEQGYLSAVDPETGDNVGHTLTDMPVSLCPAPGGPLRFSRDADGRYGGLWGHGLDTGEAFYTNSPSAHSATRGLPERHFPIRNFLSVPVVLGSAVVGQIALANCPSGYAERHLEGIRRLAEYYALAVQRQNAERTLRAREEQLRQSQKLEAVGRLAGGVAHDFNNLLTTILGYADMLVAGSSLDAEAVQEVGEIRAAAQRAAALTRQLLAFSRKQVLQPRSTSLNELLGGLHRMLRRLIPESIELSLVLAPQLGQVMADPVQLEQVVINLAVNARDAMPEGGCITLETADTELDSDYARRHPEVSPGPYVMLAVSDTGRGMDRETLRRAFEPFFTTKEVGAGTGLGLSTVFGIVRQSGGHITAYSEPGSGTTFKIYLPRIAAAPAREAAAREPRLPQGRGERILLVEDDQALRRLTLRILASAGYTVDEAANGAEALAALGGEPPRLLITDVVMPQMGGRQLADRLLALVPGLQVLYISGYTENAIVHQGVLEEGVNFLHKPFSPRVLLEKVRDILAG